MFYYKEKEKNYCFKLKTNLFFKTPLFFNYLKKKTKFNKNKILIIKEPMIDFHIKKKTNMISKIEFLTVFFFLIFLQYFKSLNIFNNKKLF